MEEHFFPTALERDVVSPGGERFAAALTREDALAMGFVTDRPCRAQVMLAGECTSTFDLAWELFPEDGGAPPWSAALALYQSRGRGQLRREWISPPGNLYVSFILPPAFAALGDMASLATGYCVHAALAAMGIRTRLKWPNDLLLGYIGEEGKFGGLLLEERGGRLLAGLGLNLRSAPDQNAMRPGRAVPAAALKVCDRGICTFWLDLVDHMHAVYLRDIVQAQQAHVREKTEHALAWRGRRVYAEDPDVIGELAGLGMDGALILRTEAGPVTVTSGSIVSAEERGGQTPFWDTIS